ncbi:MAG: STELLO glycosyltransferase family protein [Planctomycetota bacterium]|jgi:hypothetical protein
MKDEISVVVTSIARPNKVLRSLAEGCVEKGYPFIVIGDESSPREFHIEGCDFYGLERQRQTELKFARKCPTRHYARKNVGYLLAILKGSSIIIETDDDNIPYPEFWAEPQRVQHVPVIKDSGWVNVYRYFSDENIWPRGFPLERAKEPVAPYESLGSAEVNCPIQQGLSDDNPDVDAVFRLTSALPQTFRRDRRVALGGGSWCPFNSQNTVWWADAFELLYLPSYCSFRMTDIWRSFVAQRIARLNGWAILFHEPTVRQERNEHDLLRDFSDEIPGYLHNREIGEALAALPLEAGVEKIGANLKVCYEKLISMSLIGEQESQLVEAWLEDVGRVRQLVRG